MYFENNSLKKVPPPANYSLRINVNVLFFNYVLKHNNDFFLTYNKKSYICWNNICKYFCATKKYVSLRYLT